MPKSDTKNILFSAPTAEEIGKVTASIIRAVKTDRDLSNMQVAAALGVDTDTIRNLEDRKTKKVPAAVISGIGAVYGVEYVQPYMALFDCKAVKLCCEEAVNALPALTGLVAKMACALNNGRTQIDHISLAGMLTELREVDAVVATLRARASEMGLPA